MSDRPIGLGKVAENGTLNENGAFYSVQDINVLLENGITSINISDKIIYEEGNIAGINIAPEQLKEYLDNGKMVFFTVTAGIYNSTYTLCQLNMYEDAIVEFFRNSQVLTFEESGGVFVIT